MLRSFGVSKLTVIDVRSEAAFRQAHVPFAVNVPAEGFRANLDSPAKLAGILGAAGVDARDRLAVAGAVELVASPLDPRARGDDGIPGSRQRIDERRLAEIRVAEHGDLHSNPPHNVIFIRSV